MAIKPSQTNNVTTASNVLLPNVASVITEFIIGCGLVVVSLFGEWGAVNAAKQESSVFASLKSIFSNFSDAISHTSYGKTAVTIVFWLLIGVVSYAILITLLSYSSQAWQVYDQKKHHVFPRWYSGKSYQLDALRRLGLWLAKHTLAYILLVFSLFFVLPLGMAYAKIGALDGIEPLYLLYAAVTVLFAGRLCGIALCILSKKITAWYARD